ncbi:MAG: acyl-CoA dehydrogenase family protein, partial [Burkholderiales bacterium]|nr:acyl-CoA dehydrogenase family protein [Burkholderiales bacterium]
MQAFDWQDPLRLDAQLSDDERAVRDAAAAYAQGRLAPRVLQAFREEKTDPAIFREMGELGLLGSTLPAEYGCAGLNQVCYGLVAREIERVDAGYRSMLSVQSSLVMLPIWKFGTEALKHFGNQNQSGVWRTDKDKLYTTETGKKEIMVKLLTLNGNAVEFE